MNGASFSDLLPTFAVLVGLGLVMFFAGAAVFRRRFV
jgi:hypothetical protein